MIITVIANSNPILENGLAHKQDSTLITRGTNAPPTLLTIKDASCNDCDVALKAFADLSPGGGSDVRTNDKIRGIQAGVVGSDTITFTLEKDCKTVATLDDDTYGTYRALGSIATHPLISDMELEWHKVLHDNDLGVGSYRMKTVVSSLGQTNIYYTPTFTVRFYHDDLARRTSKFVWFQNGFVEGGLDLTGLNVRQELRVPGIFGYREKGLEITEVKKLDNTLEQIQAQRTNEYLFKSELVTAGIDSYLSDDMMIANEVAVYDYNYDINFHQNVIDFKVRPLEFDDEEYPELSKRGIFVYRFGDRKEDQLKRNWK